MTGKTILLYFSEIIDFMSIKAVTCKLMGFAHTFQLLDVYGFDNI